MKKSTKIILGIIVLVIVVVLAIVFYKPVPKETIKIGVLADLSGDYVSLLRGIPRGVKLAVTDLKKEIDGEIQLIIEDQKSCDAKETVTIMNKLVGIDRVDMIIGGTCSNTTLAAAPIANQAKIIMISPSSSAPSISQAGEYVFRTYVSDLLRAKDAARLGYTLGKRKMAFITEISNDAMVELNRGAKEEFVSLGREVVASEEVTKNDKDFRTQLSKIKSSNPDILCIFITGPNQIALVTKQARELKLDIQFISPSETTEDPQVVKVGGDAVEGLIYLMPGNPPETPEYQRLKNRYREEYNEEDLPSYTAEAYDAVMLGVKAILASNGTKEDIKTKLYKVSQNYQGVSGDVEFDENGDVEKPMMFKTIKNGQFVPYSE